MSVPHDCGSRSLLALALLLAGCGSSGGPPPDRPATVSPKGTLTHKGQPVAGASITLKNMGDGPGASALTDDKGNFSLTTFVAGDGAVAGEYLVGVIKTEVTGVDNSYFDVDSPNYGKTPPKEAEGQTVHHIPQKYNNPDMSGLRATISDGQATLEIDVPE